jgi:hypothetical protein
MQNILVYTISPFDFKCGGLVVQYQLCKIIDSLGINIRIHSPKKIENSIFSKYYNNEFDLNNSIVIYGETIEGNPLNAPYVVRWILAPLGIACETKRHTWKNSDIVYFFNHDKLFYINENNIGIIYKTLTTHYKNPLINNYNDPKRNGYCHTFRKSHYHKTYHPPPNESVEITRSHSVINCINIFNKKKIFISYDPLTYLTVMAVLCGCVCVVIKVDGMDEIEWLKTLTCYSYLKKNNLNKLYGIAYGVSEIKWAENTIHLFKQQWDDILNYLETTTILPFLEDVKDLQNIQYLENNVINTFG